MHFELRAPYADAIGSSFILLKHALMFLFRVYSFSIHYTNTSGLVFEGPMPPKKFTWEAIHQINLYKKKRAAAKAAAMADTNPKNKKMVAAAAKTNVKTTETSAAAAEMNLENAESAFTDEVKELLQKLPSKDLIYPKGAEVVYIFKHKQLPYLKVGKYVIRESGLAKDRFQNRNLDNIAHPHALRGLMREELFELVAAAPFCYDRVEMRLHDSKATMRIIEKRHDDKGKGIMTHKTEFHPTEQLPALLQAIIAFYEENKQIAKEVLQLVEPPIHAPLTAATVEQVVVPEPVRIATSGALANQTSPECVDRLPIPRPPEVP